MALSEFEYDEALAAFLRDGRDPEDEVAFLKAVAELLRPAMQDGTTTVGEATAAMGLTLGQVFEQAWKNAGLGGQAH